MRGDSDGLAGGYDMISDSGEMERMRGSHFRCSAGDVSEEMTLIFFEL